jgi:hypothetical protein
MERGTVIKAYAPRGPLQQYRLATATLFTCFRCGQDKKAKLQSIYGGDWLRTLCNGCYGFLLSIYEVQAGTDPDDRKADQLARKLIETVSVADARDALRLATYAHDPESYLSEPSRRFLGSSECAAQALGGEDTLEWSPAIIGLCKTVEHELIERFLQPLQLRCSSLDLSDDLADRDLGALARWSAARGKSPELGTLRHTLVTVATSERRADTSALIKAVLEQAAHWPRGGWLLDPRGLCALLADLTTYRNGAAHTALMGAADYAACRALVVGEDGLVWRLIDSTTSRRR